MLTKIKIRNFKRFGNVGLDLGNPVVFIGPNNSGKTSALQALALWQIGLSRWNERRKGKGLPEKRPGVTINRRDLVSVPVPDANLLWRNLHVRDVKKTETGQDTKNVRVDIIVEGVTNDKPWKCGLEFDYANEESFYCRPLRVADGDSGKRMLIPDDAAETLVAFLPPMSGLAATETRLDQGAINVRVGEGQTAAVLRNLCFVIHNDKPELWKKLVEYIESLFGSVLHPPRYIPERGELVMTYTENDVRLDLSSAGRGLQQTLLLLSYMFANPNSVLLLDEPDAHLEILRQRQIYQLLTDVARTNGNQVIAASHSEVLLNEAAGRDLVIAFVGKPHAITDRGSQVMKALEEIGFEQYYQAEQTGWVLYLEGSTDLAILRAFAERLVHTSAVECLARPFVHYVGNQPGEVRKHFQGLREAAGRLQAVALFDQLERPLPNDLGAVGLTWQKKEIENYFCSPETLEAYALQSAAATAAGPLFSQAEAQRRSDAMRESIAELEAALKTLGKGSPWDPNTKVSDDFLAPLFQNYFKRLGIPNLMAKKNFYELAFFVPLDKIDREIREKLDAIVKVAEAAQPG
ncbi:MAG: AAA family ATPase [Candidatus Koribacter versatilis]|nr:AAA family ATPase [Candidatus Koribacter versatilis]